MKLFSKFKKSTPSNSIYNSIHPHKLEIILRNSWHCDAGCNKYFKSTNSYCCEYCNFDCCMDCFYKFKDMPLNGVDLNKFPSIHKHPLTLINIDFYCNAGCSTSFTHTNSFTCQMCKFHCCPNCLLKYGFPKTHK